MIRPLRRLHRMVIAIVIVTLALAGLLAIAYQAPDARVDSLPASLLPASSSPAPAGRGTP